MDFYLLHYDGSFGDRYIIWIDRGSLHLSPRLIQVRKFIGLWSGRHDYNWQVSHSFINYGWMSLTDKSRWHLLSLIL